MSRAFTAIAAFLVACQSAEAPVKSAANAAPERDPETEIGDPAVLDSHPAPTLRWHTSPSAAASLGGQAVEPRAEGPFVYGKVTITLENKGTVPLSGPLELVLPRDTLAAASGPASDAAREPLFELRMAEREGRVFTTAPIRLGAGEKRVLVIEHAALANTADSARAVSPSSGAAPKSVVLMLDTSAARTHQLGRELEIARAYARSLPSDTALVVAAYDSSVLPLYEGNAAGFGGGVLEKLKARGAAGTSNVARAIDWATRPRANAPAPDRLVLVSDGIDGIDELDRAAIARSVRDSGAAELRIDVLVPAGPNDDVALRALAREVAPKPGGLIALEDETAAARLLGAADQGGFLDIRSKARELVASAKQSPPAWLTSDLASARQGPFAKSWERIPAFAKNLRPFPSGAEQRGDLDPLEDYNERARPAAEPVTVTLAEPPKGAKAAPKPAERPQIPPETIRQIVRRNFAPLRFCYREALRKDPKAGGKITVRFDIDETGAVPLARAAQSDLGPELTACFVRAFEALSFPASPSGTVSVSYPLTLAKSDANGDMGVPPSSAKPRSAVTAPAQAAPDKDPWVGDAKLVYEALARGDTVRAIEAARAAVRESPRDLHGHLLLGDALARAGDVDGATRAYGSVVELGPADPAVLRLAGGRFASLGPNAANAEAERCLTRALELEPNVASGHHMLAMLLAQRGAYESALGVLDQALASEAGRPPATRELLRKDLAAVASALVAGDATRSGSIRSWLAKVGVSFSPEPSLLVVASWEDASADVDLTVRDRSLAVAQEGTPNLPSGGRVLPETGQPGGPEAFTLDQTSRNYPYVPALIATHGSGAFVAGTLFRSETNGRGGFMMTARPFFLNVDGGRFEAAPIEGPGLR